jgi:uncharacterized membrane protein YphA (DoxX/SURF4 family)
MQNKFVRIIQIIFAVPWLVFGAQHFMFVDFVAGLVPAYFPARWFWAYLTGAAMIAAGISLTVNIKARLAAVLLGAMLMTFVLLIHIPKLAVGAPAIGWTRALQDAAIAALAFMLAGALPNRKTENDAADIIARTSRYAFAILLIVFGVQQFLNMDFLTAKVASFLPLRIVWIYLTGAAMVLAGVCVLANKKTRLAAFALGGLMLILNLLLHVYLLANSPQSPLLWTGAMLDLAITCGAFVLAAASSDGTQKSTNDELSSAS